MSQLKWSAKWQRPKYKEAVKPVFGEFYRSYREQRAIGRIMITNAAKWAHSFMPYFIIYLLIYNAWFVLRIVPLFLISASKFIYERLQKVCTRNNV